MLFIRPFSKTINTLDWLNASVTDDNNIIWMVTVRVKELNKIKCIYYTFDIYFLYVYIFLKSWFQEKMNRASFRIFLRFSLLDSIFLNIFSRSHFDVFSLHICSRRIFSWNTINLPVSFSASLSLSWTRSRDFVPTPSTVRRAWLVARIESHYAFIETEPVTGAKRWMKPTGVESLRESRRRLPFVKLTPSRRTRTCIRARVRVHILLSLSILRTLLIVQIEIETTALIEFWKTVRSRW